MIVKVLQSFAGFLDNGGFISGTRGKFLELPDGEKSLIRDGLVEVVESVTPLEAEPKPAKRAKA